MVDTEEVLALYDRGVICVPVRVGSKLPDYAAMGLGFEDLVRGHKPLSRLAFDSLAFRGEAQEKLANHRQLAAQVQEIEFMEAIEGLEQGLRGVRHGGSFLGNYGCAAQYMQYPGLAVIGY